MGGIIMPEGDPEAAPVENFDPNIAEEATPVVVKDFEPNIE